jgi:hypothetical protein
VLGQLVDASMRFGGNPNQDDIAAIAIRPADDLASSDRWPSHQRPANGLTDRSDG